MSEPFVSVIIPVKNDSKRLARCLTALEKQSLSNSRYEIIVVDNNSSPPMEKQSLPNCVTLLRETVPSSYAARNKGISTARGDIIAFTDADCIPDPRWIASALHFFSDHPDTAVAGGPISVFARDETNLSAAEAFELVFAFPQKTYISHLGFTVTANMFARRELFTAAGGFNASLASGGDRAFCDAAQKYGPPVRYIPDARVLHPARQRALDMIKKIRRTMTGYCTVRFKNGITIRDLCNILLDLVPVIQLLRVFTAPELPGPIPRWKAAGMVILQKYYRTAGTLCWLIKRCFRVRSG